MRRSETWIEQHPVLFALGISVVVHIVLITVGATALGIALLRDPELLKQIAQSPEKIIELTARSLDSTPPPELIPIPVQEKEMPLLFIEVDPSQTAKDAPDKTKYYAAQNTLAANPDTKLDTDTPKIDGKQTQIIRAFEVPRQPKAAPLQPSAPQAKIEAQPQKNISPAEQAAKSQKAQPNNLTEQAKQERGDLEKLRQAQTKQEAKKALEEAAPRSRPKTLAEARMRENDSRPQGEQMKQEGGVRRQDVTSLAAKGTPLGEYDAKIIEAIKNKWYSLLDDSKHSRDRKGVVVIEFRLYSNGAVRDVRIANEDVGEFLSYLCQSAVATPAPYEKWPEDVRAAVGKDYRDVKFSFFYN